ncbi:peptide-methionine (S)-S-oxide reductase, partial [Mycobacterium tuberculosis]|nr:peptide-methionine (S)-S-oxide reductase [Mycobacterium tuberculosis]
MKVYPIATSTHHFVTGAAFDGPFPPGAETIYLGLGCFWGAERLFWQLGDGVLVTQVGYQG